MKNLKILLSLLLALTMVFSLCACTSGGDDTEETGESTNAAAEETTETPTEEETEAATVDDGKLSYLVHVVDEEGNPIAGVMVQICEGTACNPGVTDENGTAEIRAAEGNYEAKMLAMPAGYAYATEEEVFPYAPGELEVTIVLKPAE